MKYATKTQFVERMESEHARFLELASQIGEDHFDEPGVWGEDWTIKDFFAHLTAWEQMFLGWHRTGLAGKKPDMPAPGYKWNQTPKLNHAIWNEHKDEPWEKVRKAFNRSYRQMQKLVAELSEADLFKPGHFEWTGKHPLITYIGANTASHYATGCKILKRWIRKMNQ